MTRPRAFWGVGAPMKFGWWKARTVNQTSRAIASVATTTAATRLRVAYGDQSAA